MNFQHITIVGNATEDAQKRTAKSGDATFTTFTVAVSDGKENTTFFPVTVFGNSVDAVAQYVTKGREVLVTGRIQVNENKFFKVIASRVQFGREPKAAQAEAAELKITKPQLPRDQSVHHKCSCAAL